MQRRDFLKQTACVLAAGATVQQAAHRFAAAQGSRGAMGPSKYADVDGIKTRYFEAGSGEVMVLIHGSQFGNSAGGAQNFMPVFPLLAAHFHVYAFDKLGMGLTDNPRSDGDYTMRATVEHALRFIQTMGIQKAHIVGHSRGALPAARLAIDHPELARTLILFDTNTLAPGDPPLQPVTPVPDDVSLTPDAIRQRLLQWSPDRKTWFTEEYVDAELEIARMPKTQQAAAAFEKVRAAWVERNPDKVRARPALARNSGTGWWLYDVKDETLEAIRSGRLKTPTFILWGLNDPGAPLKLGIELMELIAKSVSRVRMHIFNRSGHFPYAEYPAEVAKLLLDFAAPQK